MFEIFGHHCHILQNTIISQSKKLNTVRIYFYRILFYSLIFDYSATIKGLIIHTVIMV
jgi:hypothetical protein